MEPVLYLIRHGRTAYNEGDIFRGLDDVPLSRNGIGDALEAKEFLEGIDPLYYVSSDRKRARQTAHIIAGEHVDEIVTSPKLTPWDIGKFAGKPKTENSLAAFQKYIDNPYLVIPGGESLEEFKARIVPVLDECFDYACNTGVGFMIAHSSIIHELGKALHDDMSVLAVEPGGVVVLGFEDSKPTARPVFKAKPAPTQNPS